ncbi:sugar phosphate nucleotidyltransferase [Natronorubrum aibiense]|uniref:NTP transferase domain-containing protein n=1 Tax=Natronorubrum aibiense TaxID=348826 RepID=A0A5P9P2D7_9EURY|nr:sugar phosphate nucleotidyltransferase [Natronorubrum aibiense]QFU82293.1 NTP transferase domain-containing protein [Natronorubrum aibiense]
MDAIVLAGGYATRLWPITRRRPKMFLPIDGTTVIDRIFEELEADDRIQDVYVSTNTAFVDEFESHLTDRPYKKPTLSVEETTHENEKLGVVGALAQLVEREGLSEDTLIIAGDNYISFDVGDFIDHFESHGTPTIAAYDVGTPENATQYGVVDVEDGRVVDFEEKPDDPESSLISIACYGFPAEALDLLETYLENGNNSDEPGWFLQWLQARKPVHAFSFDGAWFDIGTPGSYLDAICHHLEGSSSIASSARIKNSQIGENVLIMEGAEVVDATIERAVIFPGTTITDASVRNSVLDEASVVEGVDLDGGVIGSHTKLRDKQSQKRTEQAPEIV